jgi:hypothetical protein
VHNSEAQNIVPLEGHWAIEPASLISHAKSKIRAAARSLVQRGIVDRIHYCKMHFRGRVKMMFLEVDSTPVASFHI